MIDGRTALAIGAVGAVALLPLLLSGGCSLPSDGRPLTIAQVKCLAEATARRHAPSVDPLMLRAMVEIESSRSPVASRFEPHIPDHSIGLLQTLVTTARDLYDNFGDRSFPRPSFQSLQNPATSMYFGARYVAWLQGHAWFTGTEEWLVRAYNGGPGGPRRASTLDHFRRYVEAKNRLIANDAGLSL